MATLAVPLDRMPLFVRQGGIVPEQPSTEGVGPPHLATLVYPGSKGSFGPYGEVETGLGYTKGQPTETLTTTSSNAAAGGPPMVRVTIDASRGSYPGESISGSTTIELVDVTRPDQVTLDGRSLSARSASGPRWSYQASSSTLTVDVGSRPVEQKARVVAVGATPVVRGETIVASSASS